MSTEERLYGSEYIHREIKELKKQVEFLLQTRKVLAAEIDELKARPQAQPQVVTHNHYHYQTAPVLQPPWQAV